jgi:hypothetical protein
MSRTVVDTQVALPGEIARNTDLISSSIEASEPNQATGTFVVTSSYRTSRQQTLRRRSTFADGSDE